MLLLSLLFLSTAVASPLLGIEQCAHGPQYWCQNVKTADQCKAVTHCQQNVWNQPQMKSVPCDLCKEVVLVVVQTLKNNATQTEVLGYLEKACQLVPDQGLAAECKEMVDQYFPILMGIIIGSLEDPGVACGAMGLCKCQQAALAELKKLKQLESNEIPKVDLAKSVSPFLLNVPELLYPQKSPEKESAKPKGTKEVCQDCITFLTTAQTEAKNNDSFVESLIQNIENQCGNLGPGMSDLCKQYVSQYAASVVQLLLVTPPKTICSYAGFCAETNKFAALLKLHSANPRPAAKTVPAMELVPATKVESHVRMVRVRESPSCAICEFVMKQLESMLEDESTEEEVIQAVEKVCTYLPSSLTAQCQDLVETYGKAIIDLLVQQADPKSVCTVIALCNGSRRTFVPALQQSRLKEGAYCKVCKTVVVYVDSILEKNATEAEIEEAVRKVCSFLPDSMQTECDQLVQQYEPVLVQLLLQMLDPDFVCLKLGACPEAHRPLLGTEQCTRGPGYWCKSMETALQCNAVDHCKRHMWV
ncbi:prosaposin [Neosynchiropus ocellatus]